MFDGLSDSCIVTLTMLCLLQRGEDNLLHDNKTCIHLAHLGDETQAFYVYEHLSQKFLIFFSKCLELGWH